MLTEQLYRETLVKQKINKGLFHFICKKHCFVFIRLQGIRICSKYCFVYRTIWFLLGVQSVHTEQNLICARSQRAIVWRMETLWFLSYYISAFIMSWWQKSISAWINVYKPNYFHSRALLFIISSWRLKVKCSQRVNNHLFPVMVKGEPLCHRWLEESFFMSFCSHSLVD